MPTSAFMGTDVFSIILWSISTILIVVCGYIIIKKEYRKLLHVGPFAISLVALSIFFVSRYSDLEAKGDCLFRSSEGLYTKWGKCITKDFDDFEYINDESFYDLSRWDLGIYPEAENAIGGPYFYRLEKLTINLEDEGRDYAYDDSDDKVYYNYENYQIEYKFSIYNSKGDWTGEHSVTECFSYFPDEKVIDGEYYSYEFNYEDIEYSWTFVENLHESVESQLHDYIVDMAQNSVKQTTSVQNSSISTTANQPTEKSQYTPQKYERQVPV